MTASPSESLLRVRPDDLDYRARAAGEAAFWHDVHPLGLEAQEDQLEPGPIEAYQNERFTGDPAVPWHDAIARRGDFRNGLVLGTSALTHEARLLEANPSLHVTFMDISEGALARRAARLGPRFPGRVDTTVADLNFVELPADSHDLIVSSSTVHHVTNLEHLAAQINAALAGGGAFFLHDYVAEPRFQFRAEKRRIFEALFDRSRARAGQAPGVEWLDDSDLSPLCGVRADEILPVFRQHLREVDVRTSGALTVPLMRCRPRQSLDDLRARRSAGIAQRIWRRVSRSRRGLRLQPQKRITMDPELLHDLILVGDVLTEAGVLLPGNAFATYRKRA